MKKNNIKKSITALVLSVAALTSVCAMSASAATVSNLHPNSSISVTAQKKAAPKTFSFTGTGKTSYGYDWDYSVNKTNVTKINVKYDFKLNKYTFTFTGVKPGDVTYKLMYMKNDKTKIYTTVKLHVDKALNVTRTA